MKANKVAVFGRSIGGRVLCIVSLADLAGAQAPLSWDQVKSRFESTNPALKADALNVDEMRAEEITAYLRPNPQFTLSTDGTQIVPHDGSWVPFKGTDVVPTLSYLHEREHKRELRLESAKDGTRIAESQHEDLKRNLEFTLRAAFVNTLQEKAILELAKADLEYYDKIIEISRERYKAGDIAQVDFDRIKLLRVQYEVEIQTAIVNLRTAKIQFLQLLDDRTPVDQFDVSGPFDCFRCAQASRRFPPNCARCTTRPAGRARDHSAVADEPQVGRLERLNRPHFQRVVYV